MRERTINWGKYGEPKKNSEQSNPVAQNKNDRKINWGKYGKPSSKTEISPLEAEGQYLKGIGKGSLKRLGEFGSSALNAPTALSEFLGGKKLYPHFKPFYEPEAPQSEIEASGQRMGPGVAEFGALLPPLKAAKLASELPEGAALISRLLQSGKKIGAVGGAGALEGLAIGEPNRSEEAQEIGKGSAGTEAIGQLISKALSYTPSSRYKLAENQFNKAIENQEAQNQALKIAQGKASEEVGLQKPERIIPRIETKNAQIADAIDRLKELPAEDFPSVTHAAHTQLPIIAKENLENLNNAISHHMGSGNNPDKPLAHNIADTFEGRRNPETGKREGGIKQQIGEEFNNVRDDLADQDFKLPQKMSDSEIRSLAESSANRQYENRASEDLIKGFENSIRRNIESKGGKSVSAQTYFDNYRSLDHEIRDEIYYLSKNKATLTPNEIKAQKRKISDMQQKFQNMEDVISEQSSPQIIERLKKAKARWANEYAPLTTDPLYRKMVDKGKIDTPDIMNAIRGDDKASTILSRYFQTNPDAASLLGNYQFADKPMELQKLTPYQQQFINPKLTPEITRFMHDQGNAIKNVSNATQQAKHFEDIRQNVLEQQKLHHEALAEREKIQRQIPQWHKEIELLNHHEQNISSELKNKRLSDAKVSEKKAKLGEIKEKRAKINRLIAAVGKYTAIGAFINHARNDDKITGLIEALRNQKRF